MATQATGGAGGGGGGAAGGGGGFSLAQAKQYYDQFGKGAQPPTGMPFDSWVLAWFTNAVNAGVPSAVKAAGGDMGGEAGGQGALAPTGQENSASWLGKRKPSPRELRAYAKEKGQSEDYARFSDAVLANWIQGFWDVNGGTFKNKYGDIVEKPDERGANTPANYNGLGDFWGQGGGGGGGKKAAPTAPAPPTEGYQQQPVTTAPTSGAPTGQTGGGVMPNAMTSPPGARQFTAGEPAPGTTPPLPTANVLQQQIKIPDVQKNITPPPIPTQVTSPFTGGAKQDQASPQFFSGRTAPQRGWMGGGNWVTSDERLKTKGLAPPPVPKFSDWRK